MASNKNDPVKIALLTNASNDYDEAFKTCVKKGREYQNRISNTGGIELGVATVGIIAGSIVVPALAAKAAAKSVIAAWGGVSGSANAIQYAANEKGISAANYSAAYTVMTNKMMAAMSKYNSAGTDVTKARNAVSELIIACQFPSPGEIAAAIPPSAPMPPKTINFSRGANDTAIVTITPGADTSGNSNVIDYIATISPVGPVVHSTDFRAPEAPTFRITAIPPGSYTLTIRAQNKVGTSPALIEEVK
ncbi:fibronectin type III domain-containing protein [Janthinobacterium lividum]|uniref:Fibronectin type III domain-containing protein n=1 Tax=Janthinobacterium lividum TaxID=29581 RepID=A0ABU0XND6_9BURK|nr:fibronectin type III domain-containing protein [Janthinobacterium lividum]MDQ4625027.1 fibronectin type III domain-containing protein [Janthinobacterium lividum]MDQ4673370.1 fibronectin type III domain-containing protein [Janthinobacterium lividum]MDQ4684100.1 fibronectin type III domain-containing protein [Janthinobacterium lividum]